MRELSHKKGLDYQKAVRDWLRSRPLLGLRAEAFGDAYDCTRKAAVLGKTSYDFSLKLMRGQAARQILYFECKYRRERGGNINKEFGEFISKAYCSCAAGLMAGEEGSEFCFVSNIPPDGWRTFINNKYSYSQKHLTKSAIRVNRTTLGHLVNRLHVLVLGEAIIKGY